MNYLAHIYLSGEDASIKIGNFIADGIHGKKYKVYPKSIQKGILLHREIDTFTDANPIFRKSTKRLHKNYSHYSGIIVDIFYDHFLAKNWKNYATLPLEEYVFYFYKLIQDNIAILPQRIQKMMPYMIADNWLVSYAKIEGIANVLKGMDTRTNHRSKMQFAINELTTYYEEFEAEFTAFFAEIMLFSKQKIKEINP